MSGLSHILEGEGLSTATIGLIPQHVRRMRPPRALLVPFDLGRPLGAPNRPELQRQVLDATLALLDEARSAPHITELEVSVPLDEGRAGEADGGEGWSCPVNFPAPTPGTDPLTRVQEEVRLLRPWYDRGQRDRGFTAVGASDLEVAEIVSWLFQLVDGGDADDSGSGDGNGDDTGPDAAAEPLEEGELGLRFKLAVEDLKAFYLEAATAQPGPTSATAAFDWFWDSTSAAALLRRLRDSLAQHEDPLVRIYAGATLVPALRP